MTETPLSVTAGVQQQSSKQLPEQACSHAADLGSLMRAARRQDRVHHQVLLPSPGPLPPRDRLVTRKKQDAQRFSVTAGSPDLALVS